MRLFDIIGRMLLGGAIRRTLWRSPRALLIVAAVVGLALMSIGSARAQQAGCTYTNATTAVCETQGEAYAAANAMTGNVSCYTSGVTYQTVQAPNGRRYQRQFLVNAPGSCGQRAGSVMPVGSASWRTDCPADSPWSEQHKRCLEACPPGSQRMDNGECSPTSEECSNRNGEGFGVQASKPFRSRCVAGCTLQMEPGGSCSTVAVPGHDFGHTVCNGSFSWTGGVCGATPPPDPFVPGPETVEEASKNKPQECVPAGANQTMCVKQNGDHCYTSGSGRQTCWKPGETGTKTDGPNAQVRNAGNEAVPPNPNLSSGDTLAKSGDAVTTRTGPGGGSSSTTTTTTVNYVTIHGTNAGPKNQGEKSDGSESPSDDEKGTASGGADCTQKPIVSDPMLGMVATQAWATRCAVEAGNAVKVTGDVADCKSNFSVEGTDANAVKLRAMRAQICGENQPEWTKVEGDGTEGAPESPEEGAWKKTVAVSTSRIDLTGLGLSRACPRLGTLELGWLGTYSLDSQPWFCDFVIVAGGVILFIAGWQAIVILTRG